MRASLIDIYLPVVKEHSTRKGRLGNIGTGDFKNKTEMNGYGAIKKIIIQI